MKLVNRRNLLALTIIYLILMLTLSSLPNVGNIVTKKRFNDKVLHFLEYFMLAALFCAVEEGFSIRRTIFITSGGVLIAVFDELHQSYIPGRSMQATDAIADIGGIVLGVTLVYWISTVFYSKPWTLKEGSQKNI